MPELVTIAVYSEVQRSQFARMLLERESIPCFLADEHLANLGRYAFAGGVRLQVAAEHAGMAVKLLRAEGFLRAAEGADDAKPGFCPRCGGVNIFYRTAYAVIALMLFLPFWGKRYQCRTCGHSWK